MLLYLIIIFVLPITFASATLWQSVAGNLMFWGIFVCNLGTPKTVISNFVTMRQILLPHILPHVNRTTPTMFLVDKKGQGQKTCSQQCINSFPAHLLSQDRWLWFFCWVRTGPYNTRYCDLVVPADWG